MSNTFDEFKKMLEGTQDIGLIGLVVLARFAAQHEISIEEILVEIHAEIAARKKVLDAKMEHVLGRLVPAEEFCLDDLINDTLDSAACGINNMGLEEQVRYLLQSGVEPSYIFNVMGVPDEE